MGNSGSVKSSSKKNKKSGSVKNSIKNGNSLNVKSSSKNETVTSKKGGSNEEEDNNDNSFMSNLFGGVLKKKSVKKAVKKTVKKSAKKAVKKTVKKRGGSYDEEEEEEEMGLFGGAIKKKAKKAKKAKKPKRVLKGGMESAGATPMHSRFFDSNASFFPSNSSHMTAYGESSGMNVGSGLLAPYGVRGVESTMLKTGGALKKKSGKKSGVKKAKKSSAKKVKKSGAKKAKKGGDLIPNISTSGVTSVQNGIDGAIGSFSSFLERLDNDYLTSINEAKSISIGGERLIGGKKTAKKAPKKTTKKQKGAGGSDWRTSVYSRGPATTLVPNEEQMFSQFSKTGEYIPIHDLPNVATPLLAGTNELRNSTVMGYDPNELAF